MPICFELKNVRKTYRKQDGAVLNIDDLQIYAGQITAILGYSGSGKSTLLNLLGLLDKPDNSENPDGGITYYCHDDNQEYQYRALPRKRRNRLRRENFGFVFQSGHLLSHFSCHDNVALALALNNVPKKRRIHIADELLRDVHLENKIRSMPQELSGGEYQRVAVIRALAHNPQVIFADEPTGNLDPHRGQDIMEILENWCRGKGDWAGEGRENTNTLLLVTHNIQQAHSFSDRLIVLQAGKVAHQSRKEDISSDELLNILKYSPEKANTGAEHHG